jgi:hypothetical protein
LAAAVYLETAESHSREMLSTFAKPTNSGTERPWRGHAV